MLRKGTPTPRHARQGRLEIRHHQVETLVLEGSGEHRTERREPEQKLPGPPGGSQEIDAPLTRVMETQPRDPADLHLAPSVQRGEEAERVSRCEHGDFVRPALPFDERTDAGSVTAAFAGKADEEVGHGGGVDSQPTPLLKAEPTRTASAHSP